MELQSRRRLRSPAPAPAPDMEQPRSRARQPLGPCEGADRISALTDDLLLLVLVHVGCARTAARLGLLSSRWRGLWARLPEVVFRDVAFHSLEPALALVSGPALSRLDIRVAMRHRPLRKRHWPSGPRMTSLLRAAERLSPEELDFTLPTLMGTPYMSIDLPVFPVATSIRLDATFLRIRLPPAGEGHFAALQTLSLSGCVVHDLHAMVSRCPRLRVLRYKMPGGGDNLRIKVHSASLEELVVENERAMTCSVDIAGPVLKQITSAVIARPGISVSILAPMAEKLSCKCSYYVPYWFAHWGLTSFSLSIATSPVHAPSLEIYAYFGSTSFRDTNYSFAQEIQKHLVADISVLNLHLLMRGHVFGEFVLHLLERDRIRSVIRRLKVDLLKSEDHGELYIYYSCLDDEMSWRTRTVPLPHLEEVEIDGIKGVDHELAFLKLLVRCAPILTRMTVRLSEMLTTTDDACNKIYNIFKAYPSLECYVYLGTNNQVLLPDAT